MGSLASRLQSGAGPEREKSVCEYLSSAAGSYIYRGTCLSSPFPLICPPFSSSRSLHICPSLLSPPSPTPKLSQPRMSQTHNLGYQPAVDTESQSREASVAKEGVHIHRSECDASYYIFPREERRTDSPFSLSFAAQTPGGHIANDDLIAIGASHRKIGNPLPLGAMAFGTTTLILSLYNVGAAGVTMPNAIVIYALFYGGLVQYCAGLWEYASGNTLGATIFCIYGFFWFGFSFIFIPFFGITGTYDGIPGVYTEAGGFASELNSAIGLFLWCWFGITSCLLIASARASITLVVL